jgi:hypothetical protein
MGNANSAENKKKKARKNLPRKTINIYYDDNGNLRHGESWLHTIHTSFNYYYKIGIEAIETKQMS